MWLERSAQIGCMPVIGGKPYVRAESLSKFNCPKLWTESKIVEQSHLLKLLCNNLLNNLVCPTLQAVGWNLLHCARVTCAGTLRHCACIITWHHRLCHLHGGAGPATGDHPPVLEVVWLQHQPGGGQVDPVQHQGEQQQGHAQARGRKSNLV